MLFSNLPELETEVTTAAETETEKMDCDSAHLSEALVESVKLYPCVWDSNVRSYRDRNKKEQA